MRLRGPTFVVLTALVGLLIVFATDQVVPAGSERQAQLRVWLVARSSGITTLLLLTAEVVFGLVLSHPTNQSTWKLSKRLFPWHENLLVFILAFVLAHVVSLVADPYAGVGLPGALIPGLSSYRSSAVALGTLGLYALLATGLTARYTNLLPRGVWLRLHRLSIAVFALAWVHGVLAGSDSLALRPLYVAMGLAVLAAAAYRYWVTKKGRATFATTVEPRARRAPGAAVEAIGRVHAGAAVLTDPPALVEAPVRASVGGATPPRPDRAGISAIEGAAR